MQLTKHEVGMPRVENLGDGLVGIVRGRGCRSCLWRGTTAGGEGNEQYAMCRMAYVTWDGMWGFKEWAESVNVTA